MISKKFRYSACALFIISFATQIIEAGLWQTICSPFSYAQAYIKQRPLVAAAAAVSTIAVSGGIYWWYKNYRKKMPENRRAVLNHRIENVNAMENNQGLELGIRKISKIKRMLTSIREFRVKQELFRVIDKPLAELCTYINKQEREYLESIYRGLVAAKDQRNLESAQQTMIAYLNVIENRLNRLS